MAGVSPAERAPPQPTSRPSPRPSRPASSRAPWRATRGRRCRRPSGTRPRRRSEPAASRHPGAVEPALLAEQGEEDLRLLVAEARQGLEPLRAPRRRRGRPGSRSRMRRRPTRRRTAAPAPARAPAIEPGKRCTAGVCLNTSTKRLGIVVRDRIGVDRADAVPDLLGPGERGLHRHLLVEQHAGEQGERVVAEQLVGRGVTRDVQCHAVHPSTRGPPGSPVVYVTLADGNRPHRCLRSVLRDSMVRIVPHTLPRSEPMDWKIELIFVPVTDVDRAKDVLRRQARLQRRPRPHRVTRACASCSSRRPDRRARSRSARASAARSQPGTLDVIQVVIPDADAVLAELPREGRRRRGRRRAGRGAASSR